VRVSGLEIHTNNASAQCAWSSTADGAFTDTEALANDPAMNGPQHYFA
jgi:hypothetical protein